MPTVIPYVPQRITVHLGAPSASADNVTVSFSDYVKNVASSEIYPTWEESALRANILAIVSFALNRLNPELIDETFGSLVDLVIDGGMGSLGESTVVDCREDDYEIMRQGDGILI